MARLVLLLLFFPAFTFAQDKLSLTLFGGFSNYSGELQEKRFTISQAHAAVGAGLNYRLHDKWTLHGTLRVGKLSADDKFSSRAANRARNLNFYSSLYEAAFTLEYSLFDQEIKGWTPYAFAGGAIFRFNPHGEGYRELRQYSTEGQGFIDGKSPYRIVTFSVPFGGGVRVRITDNTYLGYEIGIRKTFTDYIDDVSTTYPDGNLLLQNRGQDAVDVAFRGDEIDRTLPYPAPGTLRGSPTTKDWYYLSGITLSIGIMDRQGRLFGKNQKRGSVDCPKRW